MTFSGVTVRDLHFCDQFGSRTEEAGRCRFCSFFCCEVVLFSSFSKNPLWGVIPWSVYIPYDSGSMLQSRWASSLFSVGNFRLGTGMGRSKPSSGGQPQRVVKSKGILPQNGRNNLGFWICNKLPRWVALEAGLLVFLVCNDPRHLVISWWKKSHSQPPEIDLNNPQIMVDSSKQPVQDFFHQQLYLLRFGI